MPPPPRWGLPSPGGVRPDPPTPPPGGDDRPRNEEWRGPVPHTPPPLLPCSLTVGKLVVSEAIAASNGHIRSVLIQVALRKMARGEAYTPHPTTPPHAEAPPPRPSAGAVWSQHVASRATSRCLYPPGPSGWNVDPGYWALFHRRTLRRYPPPKGNSGNPGKSTARKSEGRNRPPPLSCPAAGNVVRRKSTTPGTQPSPLSSLPQRVPPPHLPHISHIPPPPAALPCGCPEQGWRRDGRPTPGSMPSPTAFRWPSSSRSGGATGSALPYLWRGQGEGGLPRAKSDHIAPHIIPTHHTRSSNPPFVVSRPSSPLIPPNARATFLRFIVSSCCPVPDVWLGSGVVCWGRGHAHRSWLRREPVGT